MSEVIEMIMILIIVTLCFLMIPFNLQPNTVIEARKKFDTFIRLYGKPYRYNVREYEHRFQIFRSSLNKIATLNAHRAENDTAIYGITQYADLTDQEFLQLKLADLKQSQTLDKFIIESKSSEMKDDIIFSRAKRAALKIPENLPKVVDWREKGVVAPVKSQGACGACWAFSVVDTIASITAIKRQQNVTDLCVEQVINCAGNDNFGCDGGDTCRLLEWLRSNNHKLTTQKECRTVLSLENGTTCLFGKALKGEFMTVEKYTCASLVDREDLMLRYLANHGPIVAAVNAISWQYYLGGVIQYHCDGSFEELNHAVEIIGYNLESNIPYYLVKNSWGPRFGDHGFIKIQIGKNLCGIANRVSIIDLI
ncbi:cathepsin O-like [Toxorhynchites rutilus septentrionalis]|uniref:cathepsin O-like n=1 Tax=Toxorhynchites rutilus septentrionalis TaxID=329112 RepID=UPI0024784A81|nr:cathepsin O-like [Toxorhynchites rutilus septentrionalis]